MNPVDLVHFAEHSEKLPAAYLSPRQAAPQTWKLLLGLGTDFLLAVSLVSLMATMFNHSVSALIVTEGLRNIFHFSTIRTFSGTLVPFLVFNYFFFSYFLNHGQSWGLLLVRKRLRMPSKSFLGALKWASHSTLLCLTGGLTFLLHRPSWEGLSDDDYLYRDLLTAADRGSLDLHELLARRTKPAPAFSADVREAA
jgi:hypothetical protein